MRPTKTISRCWVAWLGAALLAIASGCVASKPAAPAHSNLQPGDLPSAGQSVSPDTLLAADRCPAVLHDIEGSLLLYFAMHKALPPKLNDLQSVNGGPLNLNCPDSGLPYAYDPKGLRKPGGTKRIIVYDQVMNRDGTRWCILLDDSHPGGAQRTEVVQISDPLFRGYQ